MTIANSICQWAVISFADCKARSLRTRLNARWRCNEDPWEDSNPLPVLHFTCR